MEVRPQCYSHDECQYTEACNLGSCIDACRLTQCGSNAKCVSQNHQGQCVCMQNFEGNPSIGCNPGKLTKDKKWYNWHYNFYNDFPVKRPTEPALAVGCSVNDECPDYAACQASQCINPCAVGNPCAPSAICKVINHTPRCTCPDGYIGSPTTDCRLRK